MAFPPHAYPSARSNPPVLSLSDLELAQQLAERLAISSGDWHRLNRNRRLRAQEQLAAALVFLLKEQPQEALPRLEQAIGWLNQSLSAPPCPTHGHQPSASPAKPSPLQG
ncbi:MAG: hypothetical protein KGQ93_12085 [Cyanobacteria bacterium REEB459]|nr:hypothetical protein [Cyanobacteria bacterium REEB459]